ncbi:hypothetical protein WG908_09165 [Sphingobium sp. AN641]|uniref:hypothetical protein n=1 Tax=Sphingobium sp. AN641 TaxID=3133443 RepID=UPI0030C645A5
MSEPTPVNGPLSRAGVATAEEGVVMLDGPDGVAVTMTPDAAAQTGHSLISAARAAKQQAGREAGEDV